MSAWLHLLSLCLLHLLLSGNNSIALSYFTEALRINSFPFTQPAKVHIWKSTSQAQDKVYCKSCLILFYFFIISINIFANKTCFIYHIIFLKLLFLCFKHLLLWFSFMNVCLRFTAVASTSLPPSYLYWGNNFFFLSCNYIHPNKQTNKQKHLERWGFGFVCLLLYMKRYHVATCQTL